MVLESLSTRGAVTIPFKVAIPLLILVPLVAWLIGIRKYDFMTPRFIPAHELRPEFASPPDQEVSALLKGHRSKLSTQQPTRETPQLSHIEFGDLQASPGLDDYRDQAHLGALALFDLAQRLQNAGHVQRAVLAYERVLDSSPTGSSIQEKSENALVNLKTALPMWNPDSTAAVPLQIHLNTARDPESLTGTITTLTELIVIGSGNQCQPAFHIHSSPTPSAPLSSVPVAAWMTVPEEDPDKPSLAVVTVTPQTDSELDSHLTHGLYRLIVRRITSIGNLTPPPPLLQGEDPENALINKVTRLAWKEILSTPFQSLEAGPPSEILSEEDDDEAPEGENSANQASDSGENQEIGP